MSQTSTRLLFGFAITGLVLESLFFHPALATGKVWLFKVITAKDEIVIGLTDDQLSQLEGKNAGGIASKLVSDGSMTVWQYGVRKAEAGALEQAPLRKVGLMSNDALRIEPYTSLHRIIPISEDAASRDTRCFGNGGTFFSEQAAEQTANALHRSF